MNPSPVLYDQYERKSSFFRGVFNNLPNINKLTVYQNIEIIVVFNGNEKQSTGVDRQKGLIERASDTFGLLGAVRFLEGYYLLVRWYHYCHYLAIFFTFLVPK